jgi:integral membrane protein
MKARAPVMLSDPLSRLRLAGLIEGTTLLLLLGIAVPLKHLVGWPQAVSVMGPTHGLAFVLYVVFAIETIAAGYWTGRDIVRLSLACLVPFGTFLNDGWLKSRQARAA